MTAPRTRDDLIRALRRTWGLLDNHFTRPAFVARPDNANRGDAA